MTNITREEMIGRASALAPRFRARAEKAEAERRLPEETRRDLGDAGLLKLLQPRHFGGYELELGALVEIAVEIGAACGSSAWVFSNLAGHSWTSGMRPARAQEELWGDNPDTVCSSSFPAAGASARRVEGGIVLDGMWTFASGVDFADWNDFNVFAPPKDGGPPEHVFALVPASDYTVVDDWFVTGLAATGSRATVVKDVFVPEHRILRTMDCRGGATPGSSINPGPLYRMALWATGGVLFSGPVLGIARGALALVEDELRGRSSVGGAKLAEQQSVHLRIAEAEGEIAAATSLVLAGADQAMRIALAQASPELPTRVRWRRDNAFASVLSVRAVERLFPLLGGRGLAATSPFQRAWRDVHAASQQILLAWDLQGTNFGRVRFGLAPLDPRI